MNTTRKRKKGPDRLVTGLIFAGLLILFFSVGKSLVDVATQPLDTIDLAADDQLDAGFLPVYAPEDGQADPTMVAVSEGAQPTAEYQPIPPGGEAAQTPTPDPGLVPERIIIPDIELDAPIVPVDAVALSYEGKTYEQWQAPSSRTVGWHKTSAGLGVPGNTVLNGHHNIYGEVFRDLYRLEVGARIKLMSGDQTFDYVVVYTDILPERNQPLEVRLANAEWIEPTDDERVTLITCWPYESNTHRVVVVAVPAADSPEGNSSG